MQGRPHSSLLPAQQFKRTLTLDFFWRQKQCKAGLTALRCLPSSLTFMTDSLFSIHTKIIDPMPLPTELSQLLSNCHFVYPCLHCIGSSHWLVVKPYAAGKICWVIFHMSLLRVFYDNIIWIIKDRYYQCHVRACFVIIIPNFFMNFCKYLYFAIGQLLFYFNQ